MSVRDLSCACCGWHPVDHDQAEVEEQDLKGRVERLERQLAEHDKSAKSERETRIGHYNMLKLMRKVARDRIEILERSIQMPRTPTPFGLDALSAAKEERRTLRAQEAALTSGLIAFNLTSDLHDADLNGDEPAV